jgi:energy-converting hydrogenase Eha subunit A
VTREQAWAAVVGAAKKGAQWHVQGPARAAPEHQDEVRAIVESTLAATPPAELDAAREGARLALMGPPVQWQMPPLHAKLVAFWSVARGPDFALEAAFAALRWERLTPSDYVNYGAWLAPRTKPEVEWEQRPTWRALRSAWDAASADERARMAAVARRASEGAPLVVRAAVAFAVPDEDALWTDADRRAVLATTDVWSELPYWVVLAECRRAKLTLGDDMPAPDEVARALGSEAFVALQILFRNYPSPDRGAPLAALATPEALAALVEGGDGGARKDIGPVIAAGVRAAPQAAIEGLARRPLRGATALSPLGRAILLSLVSEHPDAVRAADVPPATRSVLLAEAGVERPVATAAELPRPLAAPPWRAAKAKPAKKATAKSSQKGTEPLAVLPFEERLDWGDDPPDQRDNWHGLSEEELVARIERDRDEDGTVFLSTFTWGGVLSTANAVRLLASIPAPKLYGQVDDIERILMGYGLAPLESVLAYVKRQPDRLPALRGVDSPRVAPIAAHAFATSKKNKEAGQAWLERHPEAAATALLPELVTAKDKGAAHVALQHLLTVRPNEVRSVAARYGAVVEAAVAELAGAPTGPEVPKKLPKLPSWAVAARFPRPLLAGGTKALSVEAVTDLLHWLSITKLEAPHPALAEIARALEPRSLARFAFGLFTEWVLALGPPKEAWAMNALAPFGDAESARALVPLSREWAPRGLPQRAQAVVNVLAAMGNDAALLGIHRLSKVQSRALAAHADKTLARVATERGLGKDELADRLVPDLGLEADGTKTFVVSGRAFSVRFDEELAPKLVDADGKLHADLPKPKKGDDEEAAAPAIAEWRELKKSAKRVTKEQSARLEAAMSAQRRFSLEHFETFFARHPLLFHVARRLVWGVYEGDALKVAFRIGADGGWSDADDREVELPAGARIGVVHPLDLDPKARGTWGDRLADDELMQPFQQLARELHEVEPGERAALALERFHGKTLATTKVLGLERSGWKREAAGQGGMVAIFEKTFGDVRARIGVQPGVYLGDPSMHPEQTIEAVVIGRKEALPMGEVPRVIFSEVVKDLSDALRT